MKKLRPFIFLTIAFFIMGFTTIAIKTPSYFLVESGNISAGDFFVTSEMPWNRLKDKYHGRELWTQNGIDLDNLIFFDGIEDGEALFDTYALYHLDDFRTSMSRDELMILIVSTLVRLLNTDSVKLHNVRDADFMNVSGFEFNPQYTTEDGLKMKGLARGAIIDGKIYMILYQAAAIHYYDAGLEEAKKIMASASLG